MYKQLLFDLDGTLTDSKPGIKNSIKYALGHYDIVPDESILNEFIGPPLVDSIKRLYGFSDKKAAEAVAYYREYYSDRGIFQNSVYPGIKEALKTLASCADIKLYLATSKPEIYAVRILEHFDLARFFDGVYGATLDGTISEKTDVIAYALREIKPADKSKVLMIGDRSYDVQGARKNGIDCLGVLYGYGSREELSQAGAVHMVEKALSIPTYII